jgi:hypothetical protein
MPPLQFCPAPVDPKLARRELARDVVADALRPLTDRLYDDEREAVVCAGLVVRCCPLCVVDALRVVEALVDGVGDDAVGDVAGVLKFGIEPGAQVLPELVPALGPEEMLFDLNLIPGAVLAVSGCT